MENKTIKTAELIKHILDLGVCPECSLIHSEVETEDGKVSIGHHVAEDYIRQNEVVDGALDEFKECYKIIGDFIASLEQFKSTEKGVM